MKEVITSDGFTFTTIPIKDAINMVRAGDGVYSELKEMLLDKLPQLDQLPEDERVAFGFGLQKNREVPEKDRRTICKTLNKTLSQASLSWTLTYHSKKKLFVCVPTYLVEKPIVLPRKPYAKRIKEPVADVDNFIARAAALFKRPVESLKGILPRGPEKKMQQAIIVAMRRKGISGTVVDNALELPKGTSWWVTNRKTKLEEISTLDELLVGVPKPEPPIAKTESGKAMKMLLTIVQVAVNIFGIAPSILMKSSTTPKIALIRHAVIRLAIEKFGLQKTMVAQKMGIQLEALYKPGYRNIEKYKSQMDTLEKALKTKDGGER